MVVFARLILNEESDVFGKVDASAGAEVLLSAVDIIGARKEDLSFDIPLVLCPNQYFPTAICTSYTSISKTPRCIRLKRNFCHHYGPKRGEEVL